MNNENYTCDWFIQFFSAIPEEKWCVGVQRDGFGRRCAYGHIYGHLEAIGKARKFYAAVRQLCGQTRLACVNNGDDGCYQQPTPKQRVLAYLRDIKAKQEAERPKPSPVPQPCVHLYLAGCCVYCSHVEGVSQPVVSQPVEQPIPTRHDPLAPLFQQL